MTETKHVARPRTFRALLVGASNSFRISNFVFRALPFLVVIALPATLLACPNCKETLAGDPAQQGLAKGIYYSILFMMSMPFLIFGSLCAYFYYLVRRDQASKSNSMDSSGFERAAGNERLAGEV